MGNLIDGVVLDNNLFTKYHAYLNREAKPDYVIRRIFNYMKGSRIATCIKQYNDTNIPIQGGLKTALAKNGLVDLELNVLAQKTPYKVILSETDFNFPYINITDDNEKIENDFVGSYEKDDDRSKAIQHLKAICQEATHIVIYDKYISIDATQEHSDITFLEKILPKKRLKVECYFMGARGVRDLASRCADWTVTTAPGSASHHDRYIIIDDSIEIILTSGLYHVDNLGMDFTYIVRYVGKGKTRF